jgi:hypothetical protein
MTEGKQRLALVLAALAVVGALAGCGDRRNGGGAATPADAPSAVSSTPAGSDPGSAAGSTDLGQIDAEISSVDSLLNDIDSELSQADQAPIDAD